MRCVSMIYITRLYSFHFHKNVDLIRILAVLKEIRIYQLLLCQVKSKKRLIIIAMYMNDMYITINYARVILTLTRQNHEEQNTDADEAT